MNEVTLRELLGGIALVVLMWLAYIYGQPIIRSILTALQP